MPKVRPCSQCGSPSPRGRNVCSDECRHLAYRKRAEKKNREPRKCTQCGKDTSKDKHGHYLFTCSKECRVKAQQEKNKRIWRGRHHTEESKAKLSQVLEGKEPWNKGKTGYATWGAPIGEEKITSYGYTVVKTNRKQSGGWIPKHRLVMEQFLGRELAAKETVHHKNGNKLDNDIANLELWSSSHLHGVRVVDMYQFCKDFVRQYEVEISQLSNL